MFKEIDVIKDLALKYSKPQLGRMAQLGMIEPQKAMMAGMMRDRIAKEDAKPPTATVAQDVLGLQPPQQQPQPQQMGMPQMAQAQGQPQEAPQPQMGMPQSEQPPMGPTQMAATGGLTSISIESQDYAGGGIVAFAGEEESLVRDNFAAQRPSLLFNFDSGKTQSAGEDPAMLQQQLAQAESRLAQTPPGRSRAGLENQVNELRARVASTPAAPRDAFATPAAPAAPAAYDANAWKEFTQRTSAQTPDSTAALATNQSRTAADKTQPSAERSINVGGRRLPAISRPSSEIAIEKATLGNVKDIDEILKEKEDIYKKQGIVDPYAGLMEKEEKKREGIDKRKGEAKGEFLMNLGLGLMSAKRGRELEALGAGAKEGLVAYKDSMKDVRAAEEKLEDRVNAYKLAEYNAKKTGTDAAIAKRDTMLDKRDAAEADYIKAKNAANAEGAKIQAQLYTADLSSQTSKDVAGIHVQGQHSLEKLRQQAMPEIMKVADSKQMKDAMPNSTFFERVQAYAKASHPKDTQNAMIIATTQAIKAANEEWASELLTNAPLRELKKKADTGDQAAIKKLAEKREALDRSQLDKIYSDPTGASVRPTRATAIPTSERQQALEFIQLYPNDPSVPALKASLGIR